MICSAFCEYGHTSNIVDPELSNTSTNNMRNCLYMENLPKDHKIYIDDRCNKQMINKISSDNENDVRPGQIKNQGNCFSVSLLKTLRPNFFNVYFCIRLCFLAPQFSFTLNFESRHVKHFADLWYRCLLAFNPITNGSKIINTDPPARDNLNCIHGLRVFSLGWVVLVHTYLQVFSIAGKNFRQVYKQYYALILFFN